MAGSPAAGQFEYLHRIWAFRYFWYSLVRHDLNNRYKRSFIGIGWSLLKPISMTVIFCLVFGKLFDVKLDEYAPYVLIGMTVWQFLTEALLQGSQCMALASPYIRQQKVPLAIFPLRTVMGSGFHTLIAIGVALIVTLIFRGRLDPIGLLNLIPAFVILFLLGWCLAIIAGVVYTHFPDTKQILEVVLQILFYMTPILIPASAFQGRGRMLLVLEWNPITSLLALIREPIIHGLPPEWRHVGVSLGCLSIAAALAIVLLRRLERTMIFWI